MVDNKNVKIKSSSEYEIAVGGLFHFVVYGFFLISDNAIMFKQRMNLLRKGSHAQNIDDLNKIISRP